MRTAVRDRSVTAESWLTIARLLAEHRATESAYDKAVEYATNAKRYLDVFPPGPDRERLLALPDYVLSRDR